LRLAQVRADVVFEQLQPLLALLAFGRGRHGIPSAYASSWAQ
jgi:hypothetical protein